MPPRKDPNAHNNGDSNTIASSSSTSATTTSTIATSTQSNAAAATAKSINSSLAAAAAACVLGNPLAANGSDSASVESKQPAATAADVAAEQRTIAYQANAKLCRMVRKCPWMYDRSHNNYAKKHILDKSWIKIAKECNDSVPSCKERWRNIRAAFARSINIYKTHSGPNRVKPYYLHKELSFLVKPMMEGRDKNEDSHETSEGGTKEEYSEDEEEVDEVTPDEPQPPEDEDEFHNDGADIKSAFAALNPDISLHSEAKFDKMLKNLNNAIMNSAKTPNHSNEFEGSSSGLFEPQANFSTSDAENEFNYPDDTMSADIDRKSVNMLNHSVTHKRGLPLDTEAYEAKRFKLSQIPNTAAEPDIRFLEALLPDMALMNTRQKIVFKRKIYQTLEEVFENCNDFPNITTSLEPHPQMSQTIAAIPTQNSCSTTTTTGGGNQIQQTVLTVNSPTARSLINNIANLSEMELQKINGFLHASLRHSNNQANNQNNMAQRMSNGGAATPSSAAARLMHSTPKITITKVTCPPPASLRNIAMNKPPSPSTATVSTTIHHTPGPIMASNVHSTTSSTTVNPSNSTNNTNTNNNNNTGTTANSSSGSNSNNTNANNNPWSQLMPIAIKDEIEDVDID